MEINVDGNGSFQLLHGQTWGQGLLQLLGLLLVRDDQRVQVPAAAHLELHIVLVLLDLDGCRVGERVSGTAATPARSRDLSLFRFTNHAWREVFSVDQTLRTPLQLLPRFPPGREHNGSPTCTEQNPARGTSPAPRQQSRAAPGLSPPPQPPQRLPKATGFIAEPFLLRGGSLRPAASEIDRVTNFQRSMTAHAGLIYSCNLSCLRSSTGLLQRIFWAPRGCSQRFPSPLRLSRASSSQQPAQSYGPRLSLPAAGLSLTGSRAAAGSGARRGALERFVSGCHQP